MRLTRHTDYALRLMMLLALEPRQLHTIEEVASRYAVSRNHMMKVARTLVQAGLVSGIRGRGGGLALARRPQDIRLGDIIRATEEDFHLVECFEPGRSSCVVVGACRLPGPLDEAVAAFLRVLDDYSLADLVADPAGGRRMRRLLGASVRPAASRTGTPGASA